ncbi:AAA family ATPase [Dehalococcoides mccartyi]|uniref:AAA family ATPase n=1 Tax=Dehalococcoides mccartyi TaxID=61435 RepID=UPI0007502372|nr:AAA family ATPase [Dehalococcoides mccartyi]
MGRSLDHLSLEGFKSIKSLDIDLKKVNIMVGANGAGKSNLVSFFRMLRAMSEEGLAGFVMQNGGADGFFFNGPKETPNIDAHLKFGQNEYKFTLAPTVASQLMVKTESTKYTRWNNYATNALESQLKKLKEEKSGFYPKSPGIGAYVYDAISSWLVYHFHDTSSLAGMRRPHSVRDTRELNQDASNIAAFLLRLKDKTPEHYLKIRETVQLIAPFLDDFLLEPEKTGEDEVVRLEWRQKGSSYPFQPWQLSDGTIRFICLATALLQPKPPSTIVIDEPELGLHPFALEVLAGLFHEASDRTQLIVSTQSATLLNHFEPEEVIVVDRVEGSSRFRRLEKEALCEWTKDFALGELWQKNVLDGGPAHE